MSTIVKDLLANFYGIGCDENRKISDGSSISSIHEGLNSVESQSFQNSSSGDQNTSLNEDNFGIIQSLDKSLVDNSEEDLKTATSRSWRALDDDEDLPEEEKKLNETDLQDEDAFLNALNIREVDSRKASLLVKTIIPGTLDSRHESPRTRQSATAFDEALQDTSSDISSRSARRRVKKSSLTVPSKEKSFLPPVLKPTISSATSKAPIFNELFCDMANMSVEEFPIALLDKISNIKMIYLENNSLKEVPSELFEKLNFLQWLDVRNNQLQTLPSSIKNHNSLETILLQGNRVERLALELCLIPSLKSIHLANNPLVFPDIDVVALGFKAIMECLRHVWNKEHPDEITNSPEATKSFMTILCQEPPTKLFIKRRKLYDYYSIKNKNIKKMSSRERSKNYKPNNRYDSVCKRKLSESIDVLCEKCEKKLKIQEIPQNTPNSEEDSTPKKIVKEKKDISISANFAISEVAEKNIKERKTSKKILEKKVDKLTLAEEIKKMENIQVKERVYNVMTNDRLFTKLRPMRLKDARWILGFIENYLGILD